MTNTEQKNRKTIALIDCPRFENLNRTQKQIMLMIAKFGYINKRLYLSHMDKTSEAYKYRAWSSLEKYNFITTYKNYECLTNYFHLTRRGLMLMRNIGVDPVTKVHPIYFEHDNAVMKFVMAFTAAGLIKENWLNDAVLKRYSNVQVYELLQTDQIKLPDLFFEINVPQPKLTIALEVERSPKSQVRYDSMILGYLKAKKVDLVLVVHKNNYIKNAVLHSAKRLGYGQRPIGFIDYSDFCANPKAAVISLGENKISLAEYFKNIQRMVDKKGKSPVEPQLTNDSTKKEAA